MRKSTRNNKIVSSVEPEKIDRKTALKKMGYAAFASSTMLLLLNNPTLANNCSPCPPDPGDDWDFGADGNWGSTKDLNEDWDVDDWNG